ncbi:MAG: class I SAM-dependent methyltransferase [Saprospiraceae bacterium]|nr:class I SAM-dependent methyltransferase [Saprospiraceae bacterium]
MSKHQWFESWFDTDYYHLLYEHRDGKEASEFIRRLVAYLDPEDSSVFCDLACGNGRHAEVIARMGYEVEGLDLSENNIDMARKIPLPNLTFKVQDMREPFGHEEFDYVLNLFTSFGYFESDEDHRQTIKNMAMSLKNDGRAIVDYLNVHFVENSLRQESVERHGDVDFHIRRLMSDRDIVKEIKVIDNNDVRYFEERVRRFDLDDFKEMITGSGMQLEQVFGDYYLNGFEEQTSPRLIMIAHKP